MKSPTPETQCTEGIFQMQCPFVLLTLQIRYQGQATTYENS